MSKINCSVRNCYYNKDQICGAGTLKIGGRDAQFTEITSCETYLNESKYSNQADQEIRPGDTETILCSVNTCAYHAKDHCTLEAIEVGSLKVDTETYSETDCLSFERE